MSEEEAGSLCKMFSEYMKCLAKESFDYHAGKTDQKTSAINHLSQLAMMSALLDRILPISLPPEQLHEMRMFANKAIDARLRGDIDDDN